MKALHYFFCSLECYVDKVLQDAVTIEMFVQIFFFFFAICETAGLPGTYVQSREKVMSQLIVDFRSGSFEIRLKPHLTLPGAQIYSIRNRYEHFIE